MTCSICIFAHNEERLLPRCVGALDAAADGLPYRAHILTNGCTDDTVTVAQSLAAADNRISVHELPVADKANAWNDYAYRLAPEASVHIFIDGDIKPSAGAISALAAALEKNPNAFGAAALPASGRSRRSWSARLFMNRYISGNLYALSDAALNAFRRQDLRLPFGAKGEDGLITYLLLTDLKGGRDDANTNRVIIADNATFEFDSLSINRRDMKIYIRRLQRYSERHFQKIILYRLLKGRGVTAMPENIYDIYTDDNIANLRPRHDPINFWFDRATLRRLRK